MLTWVATAQVFSGRPNPEWVVSREKAEELEHLWVKMPLSLDDVAHPGALGYTGSVLAASDGRRYFASNGVVTFDHEGTTERRLDLGREFERLLVSSAPEALLPESLLGPAGPRKA
ncbi:hypothetical protein [Paraburkholderia terrae]|jgi:hypothetical protein|uniref:hypothetical protein n=1 Tax=Paraburkholderia terrae TaxID=311230 RepID=UPI0012E01028|nr:hypothetical protein [Paraburkholderia terrae]